MINWLTGGTLTKISLVLIAIMAGIIFYLYTQNKALNVKVDQTTQNIKSAKYGTQTFKSDSGKWQAISIEQNKTIAQLKQDKDSINLVYLKTLKELKIKPKEVTKIGEVNTIFKHDTTIKYVHKDTTYDFSKSSDVTNKITIKGDSIHNDLSITNEQTLILKNKRETIDPPRKFFLWRLFQKKQTIVYVQIQNSNKFIKTTKQDFQTIIK